MESDQQQEEEKEKGQQPQNNEQSQVEPKEEEEEKKAGDGSGINLDININIQREKKDLDGVSDRTISEAARTRYYLDSLLRRNEVNLQESLRKAVGDYFGQNRRYPDVDYNAMIGFVTDWLGLVEVSPGDLRNLMQRVRFLRENDVDGDDVVDIGQSQDIEPSEEDSKEEEENKKQVGSAPQQHPEEEVDNEFGSNLEDNIRMVIKNLDNAMDVRYIDSESYLDHVRRDIDIDAQIQLLRVIGDYRERNGHSPYMDKDTLREFMTNELQLVHASPEGFFTERIKDLQSTYTRLRTIVNAKGPSCLVGPEIEMVRLGDKVLWGIESNDLPSNSEVVDGFGGNLDGAEDARDEEEEEGESNRLGDGFGGSLGGANQDARDDLDEDFRDDPNFSIDVEELLMK
ncbi:hypothetical protein WN943_018358 [Citrus x changshan-huyou]